MALLIISFYTVLFQKLYLISRKKDATRHKARDQEQLVELTQKIATETTAPRS